MRQQLRKGSSWRGRLTATWIWVAPPLAMVGVVVAGSGGPSTLFVVDHAALSASADRQDPVFDDLAGEVDPGPGVDGRLGTEERSQVEIPITGTLEGKTSISTAEAGAAGIPSSVLPAYQRAATELATAMPGCGITWPLLAGIGKVESAHAGGGRVDAAGNTRGQILGPMLNGGPGMAAISDTDQGKFDGNTEWDRAVGPMQFIPGTWAAFGADGNADGVKNPHNVYDAARAAGEYLCSGGANLKDPRGLVQAVLRYNHSMDYVSTVLRWMQSYSNSAVVVPDREGVVPDPVDDDGNVERDEMMPPVVDDISPSPTPSQARTIAPRRSPSPRPTVTQTSTYPPLTTSTTPSLTSPPHTTSRPSPTRSTPLPSVRPTTPGTSPAETPTTKTPTPTPTPPCETPTPTPSPTPSETPTPSQTGTPTPTETPTPTPTPMPTPTCGTESATDPSRAPSGESGPSQARTSSS